MKAPLMARKKKASGHHPKIRLGVAVTLKGSPEWKEWLEGLSDHCRLDVAKVIDKALVQYAKSEGYNKDAPPR